MSQLLGPQKHGILAYLVWRLTQAAAQKRHEVFWFLLDWGQGRSSLTQMTLTHPQK